MSQFWTKAALFEFTMMAPMTFFKNASFIKIFAIREFFNVKFLFYFDEKITFLRKKNFNRLRASELID